MKRAHYEHTSILIRRSLRYLLPAGLAASLWVLSSAPSPALSAKSTSSVATPGLSVPTVKFLAIGTFTAKAVPSVWKPMLPAEARAAVGIYLTGEIDQWYVKQDDSGIVLILNATDIATARSIVDKLPAAHSGIMAFQIVGLGPLSPLRTLLTGPHK